MFYLVTLEPCGTKPDGTPLYREVPLPDYGPYITGMDAGRVAKDLSQLLTSKVQPRRIAQAGDWRANLQESIADREGFPDAWDLEPIVDHFAHPSTREAGLVAYIADPLHGAIGRFTDIRPGKYLAEFYPDLPDERRRSLAALIDLNGSGYQIASTQESIEWVYENGPISCMTTAWQKDEKSRDFFASDIHPVRVYAAGDLAVAYRLNGDGTRVTERCLIWPEKKLFSRIYGDGSHRLKSSLVDDGYKPAGRDDFDGARLLRVVEHDGDDWVFVCPYVDFGHSSGGGCRSVYDDGDYLRIGHRYDHPRPMHADTTSGHTVAWFKPGFEPAGCLDEREAA